MLNIKINIIRYCSTILCYLFLILSLFIFVVFYTCGCISGIIIIQLILVLMLVFYIVDTGYSVDLPISILFAIAITIAITFTIAIVLFIIYFDQFINKLLTATNSY